MVSKSFAGIVAALALAAGSTSALAQGTAITYQGQLKNSGTAVNSATDMEFSLWTLAVGGTQVGSTVTSLAVPVASGLFTAPIDFGVNPYTSSQNLFLQIAVRNPAGSGSYVPMGSRQLLTPSPFSLATRGINVTASGEVLTANHLRIPANTAILTHGGATNSGGRLHIQSGNDGTFDGTYINPFPGGGNVYIGNGAGAANLICHDKIGIGTTAPLVALSVGSGSFGDQNVAVQVGGASAGNQRFMGVNKNGSYGSYLGYVNFPSAGHVYGCIRTVTADPFKIQVNDSVDAMTFLSNGNVGIGTTDPRWPLHVSGAARFEGPIGVNNAMYLGVGLSVQSPPGAQSLAIFASGRMVVGNFQTSPSIAMLEINGASGNSSIGQHGYLNNSFPTGIGGSVSTPVSLHASHDIHAATFRAFSDERIKVIQGRSDASADLNTLMNIAITDYTFKDTIGKGAEAQKKVIGQQLEQVYPLAVRRTSDIIPDIYKKAAVKDGWVMLASDLKVHDRVRLIGAKKESVFEVVEVCADGFRTDVAPTDDEVFVYGRQVNDFRTVDYEAIAMLNVSATQELVRQNMEQRKRIDALEARLQSVLAALEAAPTGPELSSTK